MSATIVYGWRAIILNTGTSLSPFVERCERLFQFFLCAFQLPLGSVRSYAGDDLLPELLDLFPDSRLQ